MPPIGAASASPAWPIAGNSRLLQRTGPTEASLERALRMPEVEPTRKGRSVSGEGSWARSGLQAMLALRAGPRSSAWGYARGLSPCVEPTALATMALLADPDGAGDQAIAAAGTAADWLAGIQRQDGSLGVSAALAQPGWGTSYGLLAWAALGGFDAQRAKAAAWLIHQEGLAIPREEGPRSVHGHDTTLVGWPWVGGTHSWVEPTALAILALRRQGLSGHARAREGLRVLRDRAIVTGGWNCGNKATYGRVLRPQPATTGIALLALAGSDPRGEIVERALAYLRGTLPGVRAAESLAWGLLGLRAWDERIDGFKTQLEEAFRRVVGRPDAAPRLALLLLAAGERSLEFFDA